MTTLHEHGRKSSMKIGPNGREGADQPSGAERRQHRRHDLEQSGITVERWDGARQQGQPIGQLVDLSAGGVRIRCGDTSVRPDGQIRVKLSLPDYAGICPFVDTSSSDPQPKREWIGWMTVARVSKLNDHTADVAGRLVDMDEMDRGMLGLYLSTQPLAA
jgi:hypothetical protein